MTHEHTRPQSGESAPFHFETRWRVADPIAEVWAVLTDVESWPRWWPGIRAAIALDDGAEAGSRARIEVRSPIGAAFGMTITITAIAPPAGVDLEAGVNLEADGDLRGRGEWRLDRTGPLTVIDAVWCVTTSRPHMRLLRPLSALMHSAVMAAGERGLRRHLSALA